MLTKFPRAKLQILVGMCEIIDITAVNIVDNDCDKISIVCGCVSTYMYHDKRNVSKGIGDFFFLCMTITMNDSASIPYASAFNADWADMYDAELAQNSDILESGPLVDASNATSFTMLSNGHSVCDTCMASDKSRPKSTRKPKRKSRSPSKGRGSKRSKSPAKKKATRRSVSPALVSLMDSLSNSHYAFKVKSHCKVKKRRSPSKNGRKSKSPARKARRSKSPVRKTKK
jgi:hypothetical protein